MPIAILGNSGSGKSTLAHFLATRSNAPVLDLDTVAWVPNQIAVPRATEEAQADVRTFCSSHANWIVEGCYANLIRAALEFQPQLVFLNPGRESCCNNCRSRPWEPHKYSSKDEQDKRLAFLLNWVEEYYTRSGDMSLEGHRELFAEYAGPKTEVTSSPKLDSATSEALSWLQ